MEKDKKKNEHPMWLIFIPLVLLEVYTLLVFLLHKNYRYGFMFIISTAFGFLLKYGGIGFNCSFNAMVKDFNFYQMRLLFILFFFGNIFSNAIKAFNLCPLFNEDCKSFSYSPSLSPVGWALVIGSFLFGLGMNLAMCCASGTFVRLGAGNAKTCIVFIFFIVGSTFGVINPLYNSYTKLPKTKKPVEMHWALTLFFILALYVLTLGVDVVKDKVLTMKVKDADYLFFMNLIGKSSRAEDKEAKSKWIGQIGYCVLLGLTMAMFYLSVGSMIGISGPFQIMGANILRIFGCKVNEWKVFNNKYPETNPFNMSMLNNDFFIFIGSFIASVMKGVFGKEQENTVFEWVKASIGGFLMGVGARLAYGCNIGSMTAGITANSLHGFIWMFCAAIGSLVSVLILKLIDSLMGKKEDSKEETEEEKKVASADPLIP